MATQSITERVLSNVAMVTESGCWIWMGNLNSGGYGPHRDIYKSLRGTIPEGLDLDHLCRVRCCVNPWHLEAVTRRVNVLRGLTYQNVLPSVQAKRDRTHCKNGHEWTADNVMWCKSTDGGTHRQCKTCLRERQRAARANGRKT